MSRSHVKVTTILNMVKKSPIQKCTFPVKAYGSGLYRSTIRRRRQLIFTLMYRIYRNLFYVRREHR